MKRGCSSTLMRLLFPWVVVLRTSSFFPTRFLAVIHGEHQAKEEETNMDPSRILEEFLEAPNPNHTGSKYWPITRNEMET